MALALVARRLQGFPAHRRPDVSVGDHSSLRLDLSSTAPDPTHRSPPTLTNRLRSANLPEVSPLRHIQPGEPVFFRRAEPPRISTPPARFRPPRRLSAPPASPIFRPGAPLGFALQGFLLAGDRPPRLRGDPPSCRLASALELGAACATPSYHGAPTAGLVIPPSSPDIPSERFRHARARCPLEFSAPPGLSLQPRRQAHRPSPASRASSGPSCESPRLRLRGSTRCWIGLQSLDRRRPS